MPDLGSVNVVSISHYVDYSNLTCCRSCRSFQCLLAQLIWKSIVPSMTHRLKSNRPACLVSCPSSQCSCSVTPVVLQQPALLLCRDIEAGLGEEWAARGTRGTAERPHWGHHFWRGSHGQTASAPTSLVNPVAPVTAVAPVAREGTTGNIPVVANPPSTGWV